MTTRVDFYLLAGAAPRDKYIYACKIANKAFGQGLRVHMQTEDDATSETLNKMLWTFSQNSFVPHAICTDAELDAAKYPVQIGRGPGRMDGAAAEVLIPLTAQAPQAYAEFARIAEVVLQGDPADKKLARARFRFYQQHGIEPRTHKIS